MLLAHSSGLPAHEKFFLRAQTPEDLLQAAFAAPLAADPGTIAQYSDVGFIILGMILERLADESLASFCQREVFGPLGMTHTTFNPARALKASIPPTADDRSFRHRIIQGEVQDENASVLGGVAGHAGLFSTAEDLAIFSHAMLNGGHPILRPETVHLFLAPRIHPRRHFTGTGLGHAIGAVAIRKILLTSLVRTSRLHRHVLVDRPRTAAFDNFAHQPHLAGLSESGNQKGAPRVS